MYARQVGRSTWITHTVWFLSWAAGVLSFVHLVELGVTVEWKAPFKLIMSAYDDVIAALIDWMRPWVRYGIINAQLSLGWNPVVVPAFPPHWKHILLPLLLYFGVVARTSWLYGWRRLAIYRGVLGVIISLFIALSVGAVWFTYALAADGAVVAKGIMPGGIQVEDAAWNSPLWMVLHSQALPKLLAPPVGLAIFHVADGLFNAIADREPQQTLFEAFLETSGADRLFLAVLVAALVLFVLAIAKSAPSPIVETALGLFVVLYALVLVVLDHLLGGLVWATRWRPQDESWWSAFSAHYGTMVVRRVGEVVVGAVVFFMSNAALSGPLWR
jgi:hypothetical protein